MYETTIAKQNGYIKVPCHVVQDSSLLTSLPTFTSQRCRGQPCGPFGPIQPLRRAAPRRRHSWKRRHRRRGQRRRGHRGRQRRLGADGKNESVARGSATWSDLGGQKKITCKLYISFNMGRFQRNQGIFMNFISGSLWFLRPFFFGNLRLVKWNGWEGDYLRDICRILVHQQNGWHVPDLFIYSLCLKFG